MILCHVQKAKIQQPDLMAITNSLMKYLVKIEIQESTKTPPPKNKRIYEEVAKIASECSGEMLEEKENYFGFTDLNHAINFCQECWELNQEDLKLITRIWFHLDSSIVPEEIRWVILDKYCLFLLETPYAKEFVTHRLSPFRKTTAEDFFMAEDSWNFALIQQYPDDENKHWFNSLDRSNHSQHRGTYIGEWLYFIDSNYWKSHQEFTNDCPDEYARVEEVLYLEEENVHDQIIGIGWSSQRRIQLPMGETYLRYDPRELSSRHLKSLVNEAILALRDRIEDYTSSDLEITELDLLGDLNPLQKLSYLEAARNLYIFGLVPPERFQIELIEKTLAGVFLFVLEAVLEEIEIPPEDMVTNIPIWRSTILEAIFSEIAFSTDNFVAKEVLEAEQIEPTLGRNKAKLFVDNFPINCFSTDTELWLNALNYLADSHEFEASDLSISELLEDFWSDWEWNSSE